jgi:undecaprenyl-diphosphatase
VDPIHGLVLGIVQGLTEPLPISSSAHLVLVRSLLGWTEESAAHALTFDVALHMGTLAALLIVFWRDWWRLAAAWLPFGTWAPEDRALERRLGIGLVAGTVPAALLGALFEDVIQNALRTPVLIALVMIVASFVILAADRLGLRALEIGEVTVGRALAIGAAQVLALAPGVSRSGITISAGLALGLTREAAARYAFLLATPITAGAGLFQLRHLVAGGMPPDDRAAFAVGVVASFLVGVAAIRFLLQYVRRASLNAFIAYRLALALVVLALALIRPA